MNVFIMIKTEQCIKRGIEDDISKNIIILKRLQEVYLHYQVLI